jgi:hypothetical protein
VRPVTGNGGSAGGVCIESVGDHDGFNCGRIGGLDAEPEAQQQESVKDLDDPPVQPSAQAGMPGVSVERDLGELLLQRRPQRAELAVRACLPETVQRASSEWSPDRQGGTDDADQDGHAGESDLECALAGRDR